MILKSIVNLIFIVNILTFYIDLTLMKLSNNSLIL